MHDCNTQEKLNQWLMVGGGGGGGGVEGFDKVHHGLHVYDHGLDVYIKMVIGPVQNCV